MAFSLDESTSEIMNSAFFDDHTTVANPLSPPHAAATNAPSRATQPACLSGANVPTASPSNVTNGSPSMTDMYELDGLRTDARSCASPLTPASPQRVLFSATEPAFALEKLPAPMTAAEYWASEKIVNTARQGLFGDLRGPALDVYGPTAPFCEEHLWGSRPLWYTRTNAPNCGQKEPFRFLIRRTHWPRTVALYLTFTLMPVLATVANRRLAHWAMILFYWVPWAATIVVIILCSFTNPGIVPRRVVPESFQDTGDVIVVRVPAPNAEAVLEKLESTVLAEEQALPPLPPFSRKDAAGLSIPTTPATTMSDSIETFRRTRAERLLSADASAPTGHAPSAYPQEDSGATTSAFTFPMPPQETRGQQELSTSLNGGEQRLSSTSRPRLAVFALQSEDTPVGEKGALLSTSQPSGSRRLSTSSGQNRRTSIAASSLLSHRSAATSNNRYFVNSTGAITTEVPPMSEAELETPHIEIPFRLCRTCHVFRGPRTHHCHKCGNCVDELDHHCPWTNSCVGRHNYHYFFIALVLIHITMFYIVFNNVYLTFMYLNDNIHNNYADYLAEVYYLPPIIYAAAFIVGFYFSGLFLSHAYMNIKGLTTFELIKYVFVDSPYYNGVNPWDKGVWHNCVDRLFGVNTIQWLDSRYYYPVTVAFILEEKLLDWRLALPEAERALVDAEEERRRTSMAEQREQQARNLLDMQ